MAKAVKLADDIVTDAELQSALHGRSLVDQITHWVRLGRAIDRSRDISLKRINRVLAGRAPTTILNVDEYAVWSERFDGLMGQTTPEAEALFAERRRLGLGSGLDENGKLVKAADLLKKYDS